LKLPAGFLFVKNPGNSYAFPLQLSRNSTL
jgi:hypothetical protein